MDSQQTQGYAGNRGASNPTPAPLPATDDVHAITFLAEMSNAT